MRMIEPVRISKDASYCKLIEPFYLVSKRRPPPEHFLRCRRVFALRRSPDADIVGILGRMLWREGAFTLLTYTPKMKDRGGLRDTGMWMDTNAVHVIP